MQGGQQAVKIRYLDGRRFRRAVLAGVVWVHENRDFLNRINVYPVPDADTGTNMSLTMKSAAEGLKNSSQRSIASASQSLAESALLGSQGNSGAILSQFFMGLSDGLRGKVRISTWDFAQAVERARQAAYAALARPREGTILTVIKDWSDYISEKRSESQDFATLLKGALERAKESLKETPEHLSILKEHGVVDAGAQGFVYLLEGIMDYMDSGKVRTPFPSGRGQAAAHAPGSVRARRPLKELAYRFCSEAVVQTDRAVSRDQLQSALLPLGDSLVMVTGERLFKAHLHTNDPDRFFEAVGRMGQVVGRKVDDMILQQKEALDSAAPVAVVTDSACDLPEGYLRENSILVVPLKLVFGDRVYTDRVDITPGEFLELCKTSPHHPRTSQPSAGEYLEAFENAADWAKEIVVISLSSAVSGTYQAALNSAAMFTKLPVHVVDSRSVTVAQGLLVRQARAMALAGASGSEIVARLEALRPRLRLFVSLESLDFAHKGGRVGIGKSLAVKLLGIKPVISFNAAGQVVSPSWALGNRRVQEKVLASAKAEIDRYEKVAVGVAHLGAPAVGDLYLKKVREWTGIDDIPLVEATPVLGAHSGPGAGAIAVLGLD